MLKMRETVVEFWATQVWKNFGKTWKADNE